jgi:hypothetical protein
MARVPSCALHHARFPFALELREIGIRVLLVTRKRKSKAVILGVGLDSDGHKRVTTGENFALVGGTEETHDVMTEKAIKINEKIAAKGKNLDDLSRDEFDDIAHSVGLQRRVEKKNENE